VVQTRQIVRWLLYTVTAWYGRLARRLLGRDRLLVGSERRFSALIEAAPDAMVIVDWHGDITLVNAQTETLFGYRREELVGRPVTTLVPERHRRQHREHQRSYMRAAEVRNMGSGLELNGRRKDGSEFPVEVSLSPLVTQAEGFVVSSTIRDVTERKRIEAELTARAQALERSNADLEQFASVASHDLQAPLRVVAGFVELLRRRYEGRLDEEADEFIRMTLAGVTRMQRLIDDLLTYARVTRDAQEEAVPIDSHAIVTGVLEALSEEIARTGAMVVVDRLPLVRSTPTQITQLFQNLIGNAIKFSITASPQVRVRSERDGGFWRISVQDNGIGIDPEQGERIFEMFQRLHTPEEFSGTGIGLAICKRIVEQHGGQIRATAAPGGGTIMSFTLPATDAS
jgi:PAS domain S-box-containing protein